MEHRGAVAFRRNLKCIARVPQGRKKRQDRHGLGPSRLKGGRVHRSGDLPLQRLQWDRVTLR